MAEMSAVTGVSGYTLRYYERAGLIRSVTRSRGNQRRYQPGDVEWVRFLLRLRETGMPIAQMRQYSNLRAEGDTSIRARLGLLAEHRDRLREQIASLRGHERALLAKVDTYRQMLADSDQNGATHD